MYITMPVSQNIYKQLGKPFRPMTTFKCSELPRKQEQWLHSQGLNEEDEAAMRARLLAREVHGLRQCSCCTQFYTRDHNSYAFKSIGNKAVHIMITGTCCYGTT